MMPAPTAPPRRVLYLDGLRGLAAMQVVFGHYTNVFVPAWFSRLGLLVNGDFAVFIFFIMSGFVLTPSFARAPRAVPRGLARRAIRLGIPTAAACAFGYLLRIAWPGSAASAAGLAGWSWPANFQFVTLGHALADGSGLTLLGGY